MRRHQVRRAVIVTDGFVGTPGAASRDTLASCCLGVALTGSSMHRRDLEGLANHWIDLNGATDDR
jgi:hypothetical protein